MMQKEDRELINPRESSYDIGIRPASLNDFIGQKEVVENLKVYLKAAEIRNEALDHILFSGPPGLGKTTLARILASARSAEFHQVAAPNLKRPGDIAKILTALNENDILFIDEIHRMPANVEETLYSAMEDYTIDISLSEGMASKPIQIDLPKFTLAAATTRPGAISGPLRDRFGIQLRLDFYSDDDLRLILQRASRIWKVGVEESLLMLIACRSRKTPRIALRLLRRIWDYAIVDSSSLNNISLSELSLNDSFSKMGIDHLGLTRLDLHLLKVIAENYNGGPVGLKPIAAILSEDLVTIEDFIEPYLVQIGFVLRTPRGRMLSKKGASHINVAIKINDIQTELKFDEVE